MSNEFYKSGTIGFTRNSVQARNLTLPTTMEVMIGGSIVPRAGWNEFTTSGSRLATNNNKFFSDLYCTLDITCTWNTGEVKTLNCTTDKVYGDYSGTANTTVTNLQSFVGNLGNNVQLGVLTITPPTGKQNPVSNPTTLTIAADGLSATATWVSGGVTVLTLTAALSNKYTYLQALDDCLNNLRNVTLCDDVAAPSKTYFCNQYNGATFPTSNFCLRYPSQYGGGSLPASAVNGIYYAPVRSVTDYQAISATDETSFAWTSNTRQFTQFLVTGKFVRGLIAYGINLQFTKTSMILGPTAMLCMKSAVRANIKMSSATLYTVDNPAGTQTTATWTQLLMSNKSKGFYILDPNSYRGLPVDPTNGKATIIAPTELYPSPTSDPVNGSYGGISWAYV